VLTDSVGISCDADHMISYIIKYRTLINHSRFLLVCKHLLVITCQTQYTISHVIHC